MDGKKSVALAALFLFLYNTRVSKIVCAGETLVDIIDGVEYAGGAPANVACAAAKLGSAALLITRIGNDRRGSAVAQAVAHAGVAFAGLQTDAVLPTRGVRVDGGAFTGFDGRAPFADQMLAAAEIPPQCFEGAKWFACGSPALASPHSREAIVKCIDHCEMRGGIPVAVDINRRDVFWNDLCEQKATIEAALLTGATVVKATEEEAQWLFGTADARTVKNSLPRAQLIVITKGSRGGMYATAAGAGLWESFAVEAVDSTGAGDAFLGALLHSLLPEDIRDEQMLHQALIAASAAGALTTQSAGALASQPSLGELNRFLSQRSPNVVNGNARQENG